MDGVKLIVAGKNAATALRSGKRGRPKIDGRDQVVSQAFVMEFFKVDMSKMSSSSKGKAKRQ